MGEPKVLLVDDEVDFIQTLSKRLEMRSLKTVTAFSGEEAVSFAQEKMPDVIVLDLRMQGMDGMEVLRRTRLAHPDTQVIMLTAHGTDKDKEEAEKLGAFDFLNKPVEIEVLLDKIQAAYKKKLEITMSAISFLEKGKTEVTRRVVKEKEKRIFNQGGL